MALRRAAEVVDEQHEVGSRVGLHRVGHLRREHDNGFDFPRGVAVGSLDQPVVSGRWMGPMGNFDIFVRKLTQ